MTLTDRSVIPAGMLDIEELRKILLDTSYWPGFEFTIYADRWMGPTLLIVTRQPDRDDPGQLTDLGVKSHIPPVASAPQFLDWLGWRLAEMAVHEVREGLRYRGELVDDPHAS